VNASFSVKRVGQNVADAFIGQDDAGKPAADEVFQFDFDDPEGVIRQHDVAHVFVLQPMRRTSCVGFCP